MKIAKIEAIPYAIPYRKPLRFASGEVHAAEHVLVRVHTDDGVVGTADAPPRPFTYGETQASSSPPSTSLFAPAVVGLTLLEREAVHARLDRTVGNPAAKAAVDMAIWDALGQTLGLPVTSLLGGFTDRMRVSPHGRLRHAGGDGRRGRADARHLRHHHVQGEGRPPPVHAGRRRRAGPCARRSAPTSSSTSTATAAGRPAEAARALRGDGRPRTSPSPRSSAPPTTSSAAAGWSQHCPIPFFADESVGRPPPTSPGSSSAGAATAISIKTARTGFTTSQRILTCARASGVEVVMGNQIDGQIGIAVRRRVRRRLPNSPPAEPVSCPTSST